MWNYVCVNIGDVHSVTSNSNKLTPDYSKVSFRQPQLYVEQCLKYGTILSLLRQRPLRQRP